jgi:hypothetical protein
MTTLSELINEYLFDDNEDGVELYDKWLDEYPHYDRQIDIMKDNGEDDDYEDEAMEVYREEFIFQMFNNWERGYNFWGAVNLEDRANEVDAMDFLGYLKCCIRWFKDEFDTTIDITTMTEEKIWNTIAYWFIHEEKGGCNDIEEKFVKDFTKRVRDKMEEELQSDREYRYSCDICYEKKQIEGICASCGTKYFCRDCWRKTAGKEENCPFCRNIMTFPVKFYNLDRVPTKNCLCYKRNEDKVKWRQNTRLAISVIPQFVKCLEEKRRTDEIIQNCIRKANEERMAKVIGVCNFCEKNITAGELTPNSVTEDKKLICKCCLTTPSIEECCPDGDDFQNWILGMFLSLTIIRRRIIN